MALSKRHWPDCHTTNFKAHPPYTVNPGEPRPLYHGQQCNAYFSEPKNTPLEGLKTPLSRISLVLEAINEGMGLKAACRTFHVGKNSIKRWLSRLGKLKETLLLYAFKNLR